MFWMVNPLNSAVTPAFTAKPAYKPLPSMMDVPFVAPEMVVPLLIAIILLIVLRKQIKEAADSNRMRYKRANKVAQKRLKAAAAALKANDKNTFYAAIETAAWSYLSDRLSIPTADLNKENITTLLAQKGVSEALINDVKNVLSTAEFARYAPSTDHAMDDLYTATTNLINHLEDEKL